jgi:hypothetical protein
MNLVVSTFRSIRIFGRAACRKTLVLDWIGMSEISPSYDIRATFMTDFDSAMTNPMQASVKGLGDGV